MSNNNIINDNNNKEENDELMEIKLKKIEEIRNQRRRVPECIIFKENKKISSLNITKINNRISIQNSKNLDNSSIFSQIRNELPP